MTMRDPYAELREQVSQGAFGPLSDDAGVNELVSDYMARNAAHAELLKGLRSDLVVLEGALQKAFGSFGLHKAAETLGEIKKTLSKIDSKLDEPRPNPFFLAASFIRQLEEQRRQ